MLPIKESPLVKKAVLFLQGGFFLLRNHETMQECFNFAREKSFTGTLNFQTQNLHSIHATGRGN